MKLAEIAPTRIDSTVKGSGSYVYDVTLEWHADMDAIVAECTCPYFASDDLCKHIWAVVLAADEKGWSFVDKTRDVLHRFLDVGDEEYDDIADEWLVPEPHEHVSPFSARADERATWQDRIRAINDDIRYRAATDITRYTAARQAWFAINLMVSEREQTLIIDYYHRQRLRTGELGNIKRQGMSREDIRYFEDPRDRDLLSLMVENTPREHPRAGYGYPIRESSFYMGSAWYDRLLPDLCATQRLVAASGASIDGADLTPVRWDTASPWRFQLELSEDDDAQVWHLTGTLLREQQRLALENADLVLEDGLVLHTGCLSRLILDDSEKPWLNGLGESASLTIPYRDRSTFLELWWKPARRPDLTLPASLTLPVEKLTPRGVLSVLRARPQDGRWRYANASFEYTNRLIDSTSERFGYVVEDRVLLRDIAREDALLDQLVASGVTRNLNQYLHETGSFHMGKSKLEVIIFSLLEQGWKVEIEKVSLRLPGQLALEVRSEIDWFAIEGHLEFDQTHVTLPHLLRALDRGDRYILLADGSQGLLPKKSATLQKLFRLGVLDDEQIRFKPSQTLLLDTLLEQQPAQASLDPRFIEWREKLRSFSGIKPRKAPRGFAGVLRPYQELGLSWLRFLREFHLGGCLADDMGLGKTIQVLALLENIRTKCSRPSIIVVPKSLVFNWLAEARRFTPKLKVLEYTGNQRKALMPQFADHHLIVTTYGTLRRDIAALKDVSFEYAILDEAQAIKNATSATAKACRLVAAEHRLAMSGTPVENHLGELWSLFEFLNPGLLGRAKTFSSLTDTRGDNDTTLQTLAAGLRPYILRRTKEQVAADLPIKTEQTIHCELVGAEREQYDELRQFYAAAVGRQVEKVGLKRSKIQVLEALLRLRQAACHPGLVDSSRLDESSAKLTALSIQIADVVLGGHKALVFSQFTKLLGIVRAQLDTDGISYTYLDGRTRKREERVKRFQEDDDTRVFLISLKAGGYGLNLTAADYVFLLDPWWNPAVEAQAMSRAHRIGQTRPVFAYRLIASNTVEEKILELQASKRALAESIISEDQNLLRNLSVEDLELLLS